ncbi:hypothetical protein [Erysipelothrix piscisicarius]
MLYAILPNATADQTEAYAKANPIEILAQEGWRSCGTSKRSWYDRIRIL